MKKILILTTMALLAAGTVYGDEMTVQLKSGNSLVIQSAGTIESVTLQGDSDSIISMKMNVAEQQDIQQKTTVKKEQDIVPVATTTKGTVAMEDKSSSEARIKWAKPIDDENLKNARSSSRKATWFK